MDNSWSKARKQTLIKIHKQMILQIINLFHLMYKVLLALYHTGKGNILSPLLLQMNFCPLSCQLQPLPRMMEPQSDKSEPRHSLHHDFLIPDITESSRQHSGVWHIIFCAKLQLISLPLQLQSCHLK